MLNGIAPVSSSPNSWLLWSELRRCRSSSAIGILPLLEFWASRIPTLLLEFAVCKIPRGWYCWNFQPPKFQEGDTVGIFSPLPGWPSSIVPGDVAAPKFSTPKSLPATTGLGFLGIDSAVRPFYLLCSTIRSPKLWNLLKQKHRFPWSFQQKYTSLEKIANSDANGLFGSNELNKWSWWRQHVSHSLSVRTKHWSYENKFRDILAKLWQ